MAVYYTEFYDSIPYGIVDKKVTGIGLTSFALENNIPTVIAVPTVGIIENKERQYPNSRRSEYILGVYAGIEDCHIDYYVRNTKIPKIIVTYDSFHKVIKHINPNYHIVIDEFSDLLDQYSFRSTAIKRLLCNLNFLTKKGYEKISFISATPIQPQYLPQQLKILPYHELDFGSLEKVNVGIFQTGKPYQAVSNYIENLKNNTLEINNTKPEALYFFLNSVSDICTIIKQSKLDQSEVRVICSETDDNYYKLRKVKIYEIESPLSPEKPFNFITSKCFKGSDFYSNKGLSIVVSNHSNINTLLTIDTDIYQIAGRIRNDDNPFKGYIIHIFNQTPLDLNDDSFQTYTNTKKSNTIKYLNIYGRCQEDEKDLQLNAMLAIKDSIYMSVVNNKPEFDELGMLNDQRIYNDIIKVYKQEVTINRYKSNPKFQIDDNFTQKVESYARKTFLSIAKQFDQGNLSAESAFKLYPILETIVSKLGKDRLKANSYHITKLTKELNNTIYKEELDFSDEFQSILDQGIIKPLVDDFYTCSDIKFAIQYIYEQKGIFMKPTATDITRLLPKDLFLVKVKSIKYQNKYIRGIIISSTLYKS